MEKYRWQQQPHKNVLQKKEESFWMSSLFLAAVLFIYVGFSIDTQKNSQFVTLASSYHQFSMIAHADAAQHGNK